jgi:predicted  nucleic acid-binding Zn-ribbon protein
MSKILYNDYFDSSINNKLDNINKQNNEIKKDIENIKSDIVNVNHKIDINEDTIISRLNKLEKIMVEVNEKIEKIDNKTNDMMEEINNIKTEMNNKKKIDSQRIFNAALRSNMPISFYPIRLSN